MGSPSAARTIDDFLEQLYGEYEIRWLPGTSAEAGSRPPNASSSRCISLCRYRHYLPLPLLALCIANSSDATEILMLSYLLSNATFRREMFAGHSDGGANDSSSIEGAEYLAASIFLGMLLGGTLLGFLSDHIGRRPALLAGLSVNATAGFFSSFPFLTPTIALLTVWRFVAGIGIGATVPSLFSLASEWSPKDVRGAVVTSVASFWMIGSLFVSGLAWILFRGDLEHGQDNAFLPMWRIFAAICALPSALGAALVYSYVPESPRFLASGKKQYDKSAFVCNQMAESLGIKLLKDGNEDEESASASAGIEAKNTRMKYALPRKENDTITISHVCCASIRVVKPLKEDELRQGYPLGVPSDHTAISSTLIELHRTIHALLETLRKLYSTQLLTRTTLPLQALWFSLSFGTYGITTWINTLFLSIQMQNLYLISFLFALANLPGNIASVMYADRWGRKRMLIGSLFGAASGLVLFALLAYCSDNGGNGKEGGPPPQSNGRTYGIVISASLFQMFSIVSWNAMDILTGELFPTRVRSAGMGACTACGRFGAMLAQVVNARLLEVGDSEGAVASASVLAVAASSLLIGTGMSLFLEKDMALGELKDEINEEPSNRRVTLGCIAKIKGSKDHLSDDETDIDLGLRSRGRHEYQSCQELGPYLL